MMFFRIVSLVIVALLVILVMTQIIIPYLRHRPLFPLFNKKVNTLATREAAAQLAKDLSLWEREVREREAEVTRIESGTDSNPNSKEKT
jgi:high-affinity Fe2+/Pb2+ permease